MSKSIVHSPSILSCLIHVDELIALIIGRRQFDAAAAKIDDMIADEIICNDIVSDIYPHRFCCRLLDSEAPKLRHCIAILSISRHILVIVASRVYDNATCRLHLLNTYCDTVLIGNTNLLQLVLPEMCDIAKAVSRLYNKLHRHLQSVIIDILRKIGEGLAKENFMSPSSMEGYNRHCYVTTTLWLIGLSRCSQILGYEPRSLDCVTSHSADGLGKFMHKTQLIHDYVHMLNRQVLWPQEIVSQYASDATALCVDKVASLKCLHHLVDDALAAAPDAVLFVSLMQSQAMYHFFGSQLVMSFAMMTELCNNHKVFTGEIVLRNGLYAKLGNRKLTPDVLQYTCHNYAQDISSNIDSTDPHAASILSHCTRVKYLTRTGTRSMQMRMIEGRCSFLRGIGTVVLCRVIANRFWGNSAKYINVGGMLFGGSIYIWMIFMYGTKLVEAMNE